MLMKHHSIVAPSLLTHVGGIPFDIRLGYIFWVRKAVGRLSVAILLRWIGPFKVVIV